MEQVTLRPDVQRLAAGLVQDGRYDSIVDVVEAGILLLRRIETERAAFVRSLEDARAEGERDGFLTLDEVEADIRSAIVVAVADGHGLAG